MAKVTFCKKTQNNRYQRSINTVSVVARADPVVHSPQRFDFIALVTAETLFLGAGLVFFEVAILRLALEKTYASAFARPYSLVLSCPLLSLGQGGKHK